MTNPPSQSQSQSSLNTYELESSSDSEDLGDIDIDYSFNDRNNNYFTALRMLKASGIKISDSDDEDEDEDEFENKDNIPSTVSNAKSTTGDIVPTSNILSTKGDPIDITITLQQFHATFDRLEQTLYDIKKQLEQQKQLLNEIIFKLDKVTN